MSFKSDRSLCVLTPLSTHSRVNVALFCKVEFKIKLQNIMSGMIKLLANILKRNHFNFNIQVTALCILRRYQHTQTTSDYQTNSSVLEEENPPFDTDGNETAVSLLAQVLWMCSSDI